MAAASSSGGTDDSSTLGRPCRKSFAAELICDHGRFRCELYEFTPCKSDIAGGRRYWHLKWLLDYLGGSPIANFWGQVTDSFLNRIESRIMWLLPDKNDEDGPQAEAEKHLLHSSWAKFRAGKRDNAGNSKEDGPEPCQEFCGSSFAFLVVVAQWARAIKSTQKWNLPHEDVQERCAGLLNAFSKAFLCRQGAWTTPEGLNFTWSDGKVDKNALTRSSKNLSKSLSDLGDGQYVNASDMLSSLANDEVSRNFGKGRKDGSSLCIARFLELLACTADTGDRAGHPVWNLVSVKQLEQLRHSQQNIVMCSTESVQVTCWSFIAMKINIAKTYIFNIYYYHPASKDTDNFQLNFVIFSCWLHPFSQK